MLAGSVSLPALSDQGCLTYMEQLCGPLMKHSTTCDKRATGGDWGQLTTGYQERNIEYYFVLNDQHLTIIAKQRNK